MESACKNVLTYESSPLTAWNDYETFIRNHPNYSFLPDEHKKNWVKVSKNNANPRGQYWNEKKQELIDAGTIPATSANVNVARYIHPTKTHVCQKCNNPCSIYYEYPTANTWKWLKNKFGVDKNPHLTIFDIYKTIDNADKDAVFTKYFGKSIDELQKISRSDGYSGTKLSPGVMSNAPDRLDGFHSYNSNCGCRSKHDKGRSDENMKSYTRDRRAYEYLSDGNCLLANSVMGKLNTIEYECPMCHNKAKMTADHIGPISFGFVHDPVNFQACCNPCNSRKNNRFTNEDVLKIKDKEKDGVSMLSWWARNAWTKYKNEELSVLRKNLEKNTKKFLSVIEWLKKNNRDVLGQFINNCYMNHDLSYFTTVEIDSTGSIIFKYKEEASKKKTKETQKERTKQVLMELNDKQNRKMKLCLSDHEIALLSSITFDNFKNTICTILQDL
jgi:Alw26I/Eco31I/Esp3I family type II restriction endonuclease